MGTRKRRRKKKKPSEDGFMKLSQHPREEEKVDGSGE
jgi:hypothetical protein